MNTLTLKPEAVLVGLHGDLGSGKTSFTQGVAGALGITGMVQSPTYVIMKSYDIPEGFNPSIKLGARKLIHIDAYRLESGDELARLGFTDLLSDSQNLILLEWVEKVQSVVPKNYIRINFEFIDENTRKIEF